MEHFLRQFIKDELIPVFNSAGALYEVRTMIEFSGANRGYCYVRYSSPAEAEEARRSVQSSTQGGSYCFIGN